MKYFKFSDYEGTWWCEYRTSGMQNSIVEKVKAGELDIDNPQ